MLHFDEYFNFANVLTRVRNVRVVEREGNRSFCTMYFPSFEFQDTFWNADPFANLASDSQRTGVVHRSQLRVSQHL